MEDDQISTATKIISFILTLIAVLVVFVATCFPIGIVGMNMHWGTIGLFLAYHAVFAVIALYFAVRTRNVGLRWGIVGGLALIALFWLQMTSGFRLFW